jgi:hypothetical protein
MLFSREQPHAAPHAHFFFIIIIFFLVPGDGRQAARHLMLFSREQPHADEAGFERYISTLFRERCRGYGTGVVVGEVLQGVLEGLRQYRVRVD